MATGSNPILDKEEKRKSNIIKDKLPAIMES